MQERRRAAALFLLPFLFLLDRPWKPELLDYVVRWVGSKRKEVVNARDFFETCHPSPRIGFDMKSKVLLGAWIFYLVVPWCLRCRISRRAERK
jgi:hypothetical protein